MSCQGLQLEVRRFCGAPLVAAKGHMDGLDNETLGSLLRSFNWKGYDDVVVDLTGLTITDEEGHAGLMEVLRKWHPEMMVHLVATGEVSRIISSEHLPFRSHLCSTMDAAAEQICRARRSLDYTMGNNVEWEPEVDLPLAA